MQKLFKFLSLGCIILLSVSASYADNIIKREDVFEEISKNLEVPKSYKYIDLFYNDVRAGAKGYEGLQKLVYKNKLDNKKGNIHLLKPISKTQLYHLYKATADKNNLQYDYLKSAEGFAVESDLKPIEKIYGAKTTLRVTEKTSNIDDTKLKILNDVYDTLNMNHYDSQDFEEDDLIDAAIQGLTTGTKDEYTSYFPPVENRAFQSGLQGEYEGIGAYVDMPEPGVVVVVSPIAGGPAEKSGLKGGDIIYSVDGIDVGKKESLTQITTRIKGPAGTAVRLGVIRKSKKMDFVVIRDKIVLNDVTGKKLNSSTYYLQIRMFSGSIAKQFKKELEFLNTQNGIKKIVIDLRNNPGGFLDQAVDILGHFIEEGKPVAVVKYKESEQSYTSFGYNTYDFDGKKIIVLINGGTASASEILTGTLKDYYPNDVAIIGEKSFGKGSVQTQRYYKDGSALKYTIAKWYTGKTEKGIDKIGIQPDKEINYDEELFRKKGIDNQLDAAIKYR